MNPATKRIIWILISALVIAGLVLLLWLWYLGKEQASQTGTEGTNATSVNTSNVPVGQNQPSVANSPLGYITSFLGDIEKLISRTPTGYTTGSTQNGGQYTYPVYSGNQTPPSGTVTSPPPIANSNSCATSCSCAANGTQTCTNGNQNTNGTCQVTSTTCAQGSSCFVCYGGVGGGPATTTPVGGTWIPGGGSPFNPSPINGVNNSNPTGSGNIFNPSTGGNLAGGNGNNLTGDLLGIGVAAAGCYSLIATEKAQEAAQAAAAATAATAALTANGIADTLAAAPAGSVPVVAIVPALQIIAAGQAGQAQGASDNQKLDTVTSCVARALARIALDKITASTVNWIDSGFNGSPTFVQNYQQFFSDVTNQAAGAYLSSSNFAFLCSPFSLQVKIAVAQSYAASQGGIAPTAANSCTISQITNNVGDFLNGNFNSGGWPALLSFTNTPNNNPFGAYIQLNAGLQNAALSAKQNAQTSISPEGFLSMHQVICPNKATTNSVTLSSSVGNTCPTGCQCPITTPGHVIATSLDKALGTPVDQLNAAQDLDQIISALMSQLIQTAFQGGVSNLAGAQTTSSGGNSSTVLAQQLITQMQSDTSTAQQYGYTKQGAISDIQNSQTQLQTAVNCWSSAATSTLFSSSQQAQATANASNDAAQITSFQQQVDSYNNQITTANSAIALLQQLQSSVLNASSLSDVQAVQTTYTSDQSNGSLIMSSDLTTALQDRATLQSQLAGVNQNTATQLQQCYAFGTQTTQ